MYARKSCLCLFGISGFTIAIFLGLSQINDSAATYDEPVHLASGYLALKTSLPPLNWHNHPPLAEMWAAFPLLFLKPSTMLQSPQMGRLYYFADEFLYKNRIDPEKLLNCARKWNLLTLSLIVFPVILAWSWEMGAGWAVLASCVLFAFCPPLFSNFSLATTDGMPAVFYFLTCFFLSREPRKNRDWAFAGLSFSAALASKFSMIALPVVILCGLLTERRVYPDKRVKLLGPLLFIATGALVLIAAYGGNISLYDRGLAETLGRLNQGRPSFLMGHYSLNGFWDYFPVALALKTPILLLLLSAIGLFLGFKRPSIKVLWLILPPVAYFVAALLSKTDIGYRHILPIYPFLIVLAAWGFSELREKLNPRFFALASCIAFFWIALSVGDSFPHFLAYFNEVSGGPRKGYLFLADSNLDWGQGLKDLSQELKKRGNPPIVLSYFGVADPSYYHIRYFPLAFYTNIDRKEGIVLPEKKGPLLFAVSATNLDAVYFVDKNLFGWVKKRRPVFIAGNSIFVYDLTHDQEGRNILADLLTLSGSKEAAGIVLSGS